MLPYDGDINEAMRRQDRDAIRAKIMATRSDYQEHDRPPMQKILIQNLAKKMGIIPM